jgi:cytochrome o ubiquinol oxidase subunit II
MVISPVNGVMGQKHPVVPSILVKRGACARTLVVAIAIGIVLLNSGCGLVEAPILNPKGPIALAEREILFRAVAIMMIVVIPVIFMTFWFAWRYRASNMKSRYEANWMSSKVDAGIWVVPALIVIALGVHVWVYTHKFDPYKPLQSEKPLDVQVVAQDWKWLFIYPAQGVATVNELAFPSDLPFRLMITSDTVMNSFFIPALGGQIYAMAGMQTQLNLRASEPGRFVGRNTQYSGRGFSDQHFAAIAMTLADFEAWVTQVRQSSNKLDAGTYAELAKPSAAHPVVHYSQVESGLFDGIIRKYHASMNSHGALVAK